MGCSRPRYAGTYAGVEPSVHCDWGELSIEDRAANELALLTGQRLLSSYGLPGGRRWKAAFAITLFEWRLRVCVARSDPGRKKIYAPL
jgi:hypothetical protein